MLKTCMWCSREFEANDAPNRYSLQLAGIDICWSCSDKWEAEVIKLHFETLHCLLQQSQLATESGSILPLRISDWSTSVWHRSLKADVVDCYGRNWTAHRVANEVTLKPVGS